MSSFNDILDEEGQRIYNDYISALNKWVQYIRPKANKHISEYLESTGKKYDKYEYMYSTMKEVSENEPKTKYDINTTKILTAKYKKLSLLFHPDKFIHQQNTEFFALINKFYNDGNDYIIGLIDAIAQYILEDEKLDNSITIPNIIINLEYIAKENKKLVIDNEDDIKLAYSMLCQQPDIFNKSSYFNENINVFDCESFLETPTYKFYKGCSDTINYVNEVFITEKDIIDKINSTSCYEINFITFCYTRYAYNENILQAIKEWYARINEEIKKENQELKDQLAKLANLENRLNKAPFPQ